MERLSSGKPRLLATQTLTQVQLLAAGRLPAAIHSIIQRVGMYMKKILVKKFAGLSRRYRIALLIGALVVVVCGVVFGRDTTTACRFGISPLGSGLYGYFRRG